MNTMFMEEFEDEFDFSTYKDKYLSNECSEDCRLCVLTHQFKNELNSIDKNLADNW